MKKRNVSIQISEVSWDVLRHQAEISKMTTHELASLLLEEACADRMNTLREHTEPEQYYRQMRQELDTWAQQWWEATK